MKSGYFVVAAIFALAASPASAATTVYQNTYDAPAVVASGVSATGLNNGSLASTATVGSWTGNYFQNTSVNPVASSVLALSGLGDHSSISITGILGFIDSWDSSNGASWASPDYLEVLIDGVLVSTMTAGIQSGDVNDFDGGTTLYSGGSIAGSGYFDKLASMNNMSWTTFAHSGSTLTLEIRAAGSGWQGGGDESWGIDNLAITMDGSSNGAVPEPATWAMMVLGFGLAGASMRRRNRRTLAVA